MGAQEPLTPEQERGIAETMADCEGIAIEAGTLREENGILRRAVSILEQSNAVLNEAVRVASARADAEGRRAEAEGKRADVEHGLRVSTQDRLEKEVRKGRWRAIRWSAVVGAVMLVVGFTAGGGR